MTRPPRPGLQVAARTNSTSLSNLPSLGSTDLLVALRDKGEVDEEEDDGEGGTLTLRPSPRLSWELMEGPDPALLCLEKTRGTGPEGLARLGSLACKSLIMEPAGLLQVLDLGLGVGLTGGVWCEGGGFGPLELSMSKDEERFRFVEGEVWLVVVVTMVAAIDRGLSRLRDLAVLLWSLDRSRDV